jgi:hypothetical protein
VLKGLRGGEAQSAAAAPAALGIPASRLVGVSSGKISSIPCSMWEADVVADMSGGRVST